MAVRQRGKSMNDNSISHDNNNRKNNSCDSNSYRNNNGVTQWWNWSHKELGSALDDFRNLSIEDFIEKYK